MKPPHNLISNRRAFTLLELTMVIAVLLALISMGFMAGGKMSEWKRGRQASETLRVVYTAQRMFLADNPTRAASSILPEDILPYMPGRPTVLPTIEPMKGARLDIVIDVSPPIIAGGYDPSGSTSDSLWDVGE